MSRTSENTAFTGEAVQRYDAWYETPWGAYADEQQKRLLRALAKPRSGETVLDVGCGTGRYLRWLHDLGLQPVGVDLSAEMVGITRERLAPLGGEGWATMADARHLPFPDDSFDLVTAVTSLEFMASPRESLREMGRVCRGRLFIGALCRESLYGRQVRRKGEASSLAKAHLYSVSELADLVRSVLGPVHCEWRTTLLAPEVRSASGLEWAVALDRMPGADRLPWGAYIGLVAHLE